jgi:hypothetical protein
MSLVQVVLVIPVAFFVVALVHDFFAGLGEDRLGEDRLWSDPYLDDPESFRNRAAAACSKQPGNHCDIGRGKRERHYSKARDSRVHQSELIAFALGRSFGSLADKAALPVQSLPAPNAWSLM